MKALKIRLKVKRKKPEFLRQGIKNVKRIEKKWRKPRGIHSKLREHRKAKGFVPRRGYGSPRVVRYLHPSGFEEVLAYNLSDLGKINPEKQACRIAATVGKKKRLEIMKKAEELKIKVLNPLRLEIKKIEPAAKGENK